MVTIQDVAKAAGVSPMTVSHVINDHPYVRETTRDKVQQAIDELGYRVNIAARNLRTGRTSTIGLAIPEIDRPYYAQLAARIVAAAGRRGLRVAIEQTGATKENELSTLATSRNRLYDGLILATVGLGFADRELLNVDFPVVILGERIFDGPVDHISMPNVSGSAAAVEHLIERGARRILMLQGNELSELGMPPLRLDGYRAAHERAGLPVDEALLIPVPAFTMQAAREAVVAAVANGLTFDGVFCITDSMGVGVLRGLASCGLRVPEDVKVIGFDNIDEAEFTVPSLSSIAPDHDEMAETAVSMLVQRIEQAKRPAPREVEAGFRLIERESSAGRLER